MLFLEMTPNKKVFFFEQGVHSNNFPAKKQPRARLFPASRVMWRSPTTRRSVLPFTALLDKALLGDEARILPA